MVSHEAYVRTTYLTCGHFLFFKDYIVYTCFKASAFYKAKYQWLFSDTLKKYVIAVKYIFMILLRTWWAFRMINMHDFSRVEWMRGAISPCSPIHVCWRQVDLPASSMTHPGWHATSVSLAPHSHCPRSVTRLSWEISGFSGMCLGRGEVEGEGRKGEGTEETWIGLLVCASRLGTLHSWPHLIVITALRDALPLWRRTLGLSRLSDSPKAPRGE